MISCGPPPPKKSSPPPLALRLRDAAGLPPIGLDEMLGPSIGVKGTLMFVFGEGTPDIKSGFAVLREVMLRVSNLSNTSSSSSSPWWSWSSSFPTSSAAAAAATGATAGAGLFRLLLPPLSSESETEACKLRTPNVDELAWEDMDADTEVDADADADADAGADATVAVAAWTVASSARKYIIGGEWSRSRSRSSAVAGASEYFLGRETPWITASAEEAVVVAGLIGSIMCWWWQRWWRQWWWSLC